MRIFIIITILIFFTSLSKLTYCQGHIEHLISKLEKSATDSSRINLLNEIASEYAYIDSDRIYDFANQALELSKNINYEKGTAEAYNNLGIYFRMNGIYDAAIDYFFNSLEIMERMQNQSGVARCYNLIGIIYYYLENYDLSLEYYNKALKINIEQFDRKWIAGNSNNIGMIHEQQGNYFIALEYYFKALDANQKLKNTNWIGNNYGNIGSVYLRMGKFDEALKYFNMRLEIVEEQNDLESIAQTKVLLGGYYIKTRDYEKALNNYLDALYIAELINSVVTKRNSTGGLSTAYAGLEDFQKALMYDKIYKSYADSLSLNLNSQKITRLELNYNFKKNQNIKELEYQKSLLFNVSIAIILLLLVLFAILLFSRQRAKSNQQKLIEQNLDLTNQSLLEELRYKDKLLQDNVNFLVIKNDLITKISERLIAAKSKFTIANQSLLNEIILELKSSIDSDTWEEFEISFKQVHNKFYKNLLEKHPDITASEKKLCAFLKLNMSSRDISAITNQSISSIETARARLRKKLNISNKNISLAQHLIEF